MEALRNPEYSTDQASLYMAFEMGTKTWKLGFSSGMGQAARRRTVDAGDLIALGQEVRRAREKFGLPLDAPVRSCYEAGLDGFWLHRYLQEQGIANVVVDSASIEVNRRHRRAKTDRLDVQQLLRLLIRYHCGEPEVWHVVHVPSVEAEDARHLHRQLISLRRDRTRHSNRIWGLLRTCGVTLKLGNNFSEGLAQARQATGQPLPPGLCQRVQREYRCYQHTQELIAELEAQRWELIASGDTRGIQMVRDLMRLRAIGENTAWLLVMEFFGWRAFRNRREVGALAGLTPTPYQSGEGYHEQGISKAGNPRVRMTMIEIAWQWLRYQPHSELTLWFKEHYAQGGGVSRKRGCVAVARKLLVALWRYLELGVVPAGARLKPSA
jgi:transposase